MKTAVVTGASGVVGWEIARRFVERGWWVVGIGRNAEALFTVQEDLGKLFQPYPVDVRDGALVSATFSQIAERFGTIELLVNAANAIKTAPLARTSLAEIDRIVDTNLKGTLYCTHEALTLLRPGSRIVNVGSVAGLHGIVSQSAYCASKFGVEGFADALNQELIAAGVSITTIAVGEVDSSLLLDVPAAQQPEASGLLAAGDVANLVEYIVDMPTHVVMKKVALFSNREWH